MHKDTIKGSAKDTKGSIKKAVGRATGDERLGDKAAGKLQKGVGNHKEAARDALKH